ncbi:hypothetical protein B0A49_00209 [Cryomyces minteri]|uniref:Myb/SANT-like domain-containing protein n=1 Tax=Cryomyces minteri TaxID=331657 RepID=A0A4U0XZG8_9PEZI|nr:hypothetical protein B0A49_00209 [Cryomyces minteri]
MDRTQPQAPSSTAPNRSFRWQPVATPACVNGIVDYESPQVAAMTPNVFSFGETLPSGAPVVQPFTPGSIQSPGFPMAQGSPSGSTPGQNTLAARYRIRHVGAGGQKGRTLSDEDCLLLVKLVVEHRAAIETKSKTNFWIDIAGALQRMRGEGYGAHSCQVKVRALVTARRKQLLDGNGREKDKTALTQAVDKWIAVVDARQAVLDSEINRKAEIERHKAGRVAAREAMLKTRRERGLLYASDHEVATAVGDDRAKRRRERLAPNLDRAKRRRQSGRIRIDNLYKTLSQKEKVPFVSDDESDSVTDEGMQAAVHAPRASTSFSVPRRLTSVSSKPQRFHHDGGTRLSKRRRLAEDAEDQSPLEEDDEDAVQHTSDEVYDTGGQSPSSAVDRSMIKANNMITSYFDSQRASVPKVEQQLQDLKSMIGQVSETVAKILELLHQRQQSP